MAEKTTAEKRREFQAMTSAQQWRWFAGEVLTAALVVGICLGIPLHLFGVPPRVNAGVVWLGAMFCAWGTAIDRVKKPEEP